MKKAVIYFSDIMGTIVGSKKANSIEDYQKFNSLLSQIKKNNEADEVIFSLISTDIQSTVFDVLKTLTPHIKGSVIFGRQFFGDGNYAASGIIQSGSLGKAGDIINYVDELRSRYEILAVYYIDDAEIYHDILTSLAPELNPILTSIIPEGNIGLCEVNRLLDEKVNDTEKKI